MKRLLIAALITLSGAAHAEEFCDATEIAKITTATLYWAEKCAAGLYTEGNSTIECQATKDFALSQSRAVHKLNATGCVYYYNGPSVAQLNRMDELTIIFKNYRP